MFESATLDPDECKGWERGAAAGGPAALLSFTFQGCQIAGRPEHLNISLTTFLTSEDGNDLFKILHNLCGQVARV